MEKLLEYKCPCCGGSIVFDVSAQKMKCPYCDTEFDTEGLIGYDEDLKSEFDDDISFESEAGSKWDDCDGVKVYTCTSCGGEIIGDENLAATSCPFCDSPVIVMSKLSGDLKPDVVIPFKLDKKAAKEGLRKHLLKKRLLPKVFKDENHLDEVKGIYVPFWLYDADADALIRYKATKVHVWSDAKYDYTKTSYFSVMRGGGVSFAKVPVDGSTKMDDSLMESIEPFDFTQAVDFQTAYLSGYLADKYDVSSEVSVSRAGERIKRSTENVFRGTVSGYATVIPESSSIRLRNSRVLYALYPVWVLNTTWNDNKYTFAMNGQTGKFVGDLPLDKGAFARWFFGLAGAISAVLFALMSLVRHFM